MYWFLLGLICLCDAVLLLAVWLVFSAVKRQTWNAFIFEVQTQKIVYWNEMPGWFVEISTYPVHPCHSQIFVASMFHTWLSVSQALYRLQSVFVAVVYLSRWLPWLAAGLCHGSVKPVCGLRRGYQLPELLPTRCHVLCGQQPAGVHLRGNPPLKNRSETWVLQEAIGYVQTRPGHKPERQLGFLRRLHLGFFCAKPR